MKQTVFAGIKIAEFAWVVSGPTTSRYFADHGATVVKIESHNRPDPLRVSGPFAGSKPGLDRSGYFARHNANKFSVSLDIEKPAGRELAWKFIKWADIVTESYTPLVMKKWGLDYESVRKVRPDVIYFSTTNQGQWGPRAQSAGYGPLVIALTGLGAISGWPDRPAAPPFGAYADYLSPPVASTALIAALDYHRRTGKGQWIDQSQLETSVHFLAPLVMDYSVSGRSANRNGNRLPFAAPHGVFPCQGPDRWVAIAVFTDEQWQGFRSALGNPEWTADPRFETLMERKANEDELEQLVAKWTVGQTPEQVEARMQEAKVPASVVQKMSDLFQDEQLSHRDYFVRLNHPEMGNVAYEQIAGYRLSKAPREVTRPSPCVGEHNEYVYKELLGLTDDEIAEYIVDGVITVGGG